MSRRCPPLPTPCHAASVARLSPVAARRAPRRLLLTAATPPPKSSHAPFRPVTPPRDGPPRRVDEHAHDAFGPEHGHGPWHGPWAMGLSRRLGATLASPPRAMRYAPLPDPLFAAPSGADRRGGAARRARSSRPPRWRSRLRRRSRRRPAALNSSAWAAPWAARPPPVLVAAAWAAAGLRVVRPRLVSRTRWRLRGTTRTTRRRGRSRSPPRRRSARAPRRGRNGLAGCRLGVAKAGHHWLIRPLLKPRPPPHSPISLRLPSRLRQEPLTLCWEGRDAGGEGLSRRGAPVGSSSCALSSYPHALTLRSLARVLPPLPAAWRCCLLCWRACFAARWARLHAAAMAL